MVRTPCHSDSRHFSKYAGVAARLCGVPEGDGGVLEIGSVGVGAKTGDADGGVGMGNEEAARSSGSAATDVGAHRLQLRRHRAVIHPPASPRHSPREAHIVHSACSSVHGPMPPEQKTSGSAAGSTAHIGLAARK